MRANLNPSDLTIACAVLLLTACDDRATSPTALAATDAPAFQVVEPFIARAPIDPYFINQAPDFMIRSKVRTDLVIQRLVTAAGTEIGWHTHPGPSFAIVDQGQVMLTRFTKHGCTTEVYGPGDTFFEVADQVHRVTYLGTADAVEYKVRFNTPVGGALSTPADDPHC